MPVMFAMLMLAAAQDAPAVTEAAACARVTAAAEETRPHLPMMVDPLTRLDEIHKDCVAKTYIMVKSALGDMRYLRAGWRERQQAALNAVVCESSLRAVERLGWRFIQRTRFPGGEEVELVVRCD